MRALGVDIGLAMALRHYISMLSQVCILLSALKTRKERDMPDEEEEAEEARREQMDLLEQLATQMVRNSIRESEK